jgi:CRISPR-associated endonuclease Cas1
LIVAEGFGVQVRVERGALFVSDGIGRARRTRTFTRTAGINRLVVLGGSGSLSIEAMRWLTDVRAALVCIDRDGRILCTTSPTKSEARLRRAQALASHTQVAARVAQYLLKAKLHGQMEMLHLLEADGHSRRVVGANLGALEATDELSQLLSLEAQSAAAYWRAWAEQPVRFQPADRRRLPSDWDRFGSRSSPLSGGPRSAVTPAGAILNYLYALLEAETRLACLTVGLDPALAVLHADTRGRDSLPLDLMEAARPHVDRYLLALLRDRVFQLSEFHHTRQGSVRLLPPLTKELIETMPAW